jgi:outer membrane protein TolC
MKNIILIINALLLINISSAQTLTLPEAIELGLKNRSELKSQALQLQLDQQQDAKIKASWLPQLSATGDIRYNAILQKSVLPIGEFGLPGISPDATTTVAFGVPFNTSVGLDATQKIFDPNKNIDKKINANVVENQLITLDKQKKDIRYAITEAYYNVLLQKEKVKLAEESVSRAQVNLENGQTRLKAGTALKNDIDRLSLDLSNTRLSARKAQQDYDFSLEQLKYQLNISKDTKIEIAETVKTMIQAKVPSAIPATTDNSAVRREQIAMLSNQLQAQKIMKRNAPTLSAYGNLSLLALNEEVYPYSYLGLRATMTLYDGKQARLAAADYDIRRQINQVNIEKLRSDLDFEIRAAQKTLEQTQLDLEESEKNIALARQVYATDLFRLEKGNIVVSDLKNSEFTLQTTENNYIVAAYNYLMAGLKLAQVLEK